MRRKRTKQNRILWVILGIAVIAVLAAAFFYGNELLLRSMYKEDHLDMVADTAQEYGLDVYFVAAVVYAESEFNEDAVSGKGAVGLMQIMPDTGAWIAGHLGIENYSHDLLKDPQTNLRMGCWYLRYLSGLFGGDVKLTLCAYNAGPGTVRKWLDNPAYTDDGKTLFYIPFDETRDYVDKVTDADEQYEKLYPSGRTVGD